MLWLLQQVAAQAYLCVLRVSCQLHTAGVYQDDQA